MTTTAKNRIEVASYPYRDAAGEVLYEVVRYDPKGFMQRVPNGHGGYTYSLNGTPRVPYRLPELLATDPTEYVFVVEGEKDADRLAEMGLTATTNANGAEKWLKVYNPHFKDRPVVIIPDADEKGCKHAIDVANHLRSVAESIVILELPGLPPKGDVSDWLAVKGNDKAKLLKLVDKAPKFSSDADEGPGEAKVGTNGRYSPTIISAAKLATMVLPEPKFAVEGILPDGLSVLAGKPKLGKSWLALNIALAVAHGGVALGDIDVEKGDVLYLGLEDTARRLQSRIKKICSATKSAPPAALHIATTWPRQQAPAKATEDGIEHLRNWVAGHPKARLIVIDTFAKFRPMKTRGRDSYEEDVEHASPLKALADETGVAVWIVAHCRKMDADDPLDSVSGTLGLTGSCDGILVLKRERGRQDATLFITGRDIDEKEIALKWDPQYALWTAIGEADEYRMSTQRAAVVEVIRNRPEGMTPTEVATALGQPVNNVKQLMWKLAEAGWLKGDGKKYWLAPSKE